MTMLVSQASISVMQVEIRALTVNHKQVTMGMFRQIPYRDVIAWEVFARTVDDPVLASEREEPIVLGTIWGHVNYWWPDHYPTNCAYTDEDGRWLEHGEKRHLVWADAGGLSRTILCRSVPQWLIDGANTVPMQRAWAKCWQHILEYPQLYIAV